MHAFSRKFKLTAAAFAVAGTLFAQSAAAAIIWNWSYSGADIAASGTFTTKDTQDAQGFYEITAITGERNGDVIAALFPTGSSIPGNSPFVVDNLVRISAAGQLSGDGFGFSTAEGNYGNPFFADFLQPPGYLEVFSSPLGVTEVPITFNAAMVPEPESFALLIAGVGGLALVLRARRRAS